jgi:Uma2 family endonuclease
MATAASGTGVQEPVVVLPPERLPETDGVPLETPWHRDAMNLLIELVRCRLQGRHDFFVGGHMFIYYSMRQVRTREYRGPDFFFVKEVDGTRPRDYWAVWEEEGRYPDVIVELLSPTTAREDRTTKKRLYEQTFRTPEYFCYDPETRQLEGWRLTNQGYQPIPPNEQGWLWSEQLGVWLGTWEGTFQHVHGTWLRFYDAQGQLVLLTGESERQRAEQEHQRAEQERQRAEQEHQRAEAAEAELTRLKALLAEKGVSPPPPGDSPR